MLQAHRRSRVLGLALLCASAAFSCAPLKPATSPKSAPAAKIPAPVPATPPASLPPEESIATAPPALPVTPPPAVPPPRGPAVTLLLPLDAPDFRSAAEAIRQGFMAAMQTEGRTLDVGIRRTDAGSERVLAEYDAAVAAGTRLVVGPLTRSGVAALATSGRVSVPTLALNQPPVGAPTRLLYAFGLSVEAEARQIARQAWDDAIRVAAVVSDATPLARRSREAFAEAWSALGGRIVRMIELPAEADPSQIRESLDRDPPQAVFLAASGERARLLRPYVGRTPVYATSQINAGDDPLKNFDLNGVRFAEMPWLVRVQDPGIARYPRPEGLDSDLGRFYALGIDAFRLAAALLEGRRSFVLDGVTGQLVVSDGMVERRLVAATFRDGRCVALE
jgi:outer membrane PBP1 activator LpoA protein